MYKEFTDFHAADTSLFRKFSNFMTGDRSISIYVHFALRDRKGLNYKECALIMQQFGCTKAMQFDGGHSSGFCIYNKQVEVSFLQRKVPTAFGIKIKK